MRIGDALHVLHVISGLGQGGAERNLSRLVAALDGDSFRSTVVSLTGGGPFSEELKAGGIKLVELDLPSRGLPIRGFRKLVRILKSENPDLIQTWMYHADLLGLLAARFAVRAPVVWNIRGSGRSRAQLGTRTWLVMKACAALSGVPAAVVANSHQGKEDHQRIGYKPARWEVIHNGVDTRKFVPNGAARYALRERLGIPQSAVVMGNMARFHALKGHRYLLQAAGELLDEHRNLYLVMIGRDVTPENSELLDWMPCGKIRERIHLAGPQDRPADWLAGLDFHVLASSVEGSPNAVAEAMACGVPNVVTDAGDARVLVGTTGIVVGPDSASELVRGVNGLLELSESARVEMGSAARERAVKLFSLQTMVRSYEALYREVTGL